MAIFQDNPVSRYWNVSILAFIAAKDNGGGDDEWSVREAKLQSNLHHWQTNNQLLTSPPPHVTQPTLSKLSLRYAGHFSGELGLASVYWS